MKLRKKKIMQIRFKFDFLTGAKIQFKVEFVFLKFKVPSGKKNTCEFSNCEKQKKK